MFLENTAGDKNRRRKVSSQDVREIRAAVQNGAEIKSLAEKYKVHPLTIQKIVKRENWRCVE